MIINKGREGRRRRRRRKRAIKVNKRVMMGCNVERVMGNDEGE